MDIKRKNELTTIIVEGERIMMSAFFKGHKHSIGDEFQNIRDKVEFARCELFNYNPNYCKPQYIIKKGT
jgi:hypothetical protein